MTNFFMAQMVVSQRMPLLWLETIGLAPPGRKESERMVTEKIDAVSEGLMAVQRELVMTSIDMGTAMLSGGSPIAAAIRGTERAARAGMAPGERKMRHNIRRLAK